MSKPAPGRFSPGNSKRNVYLPVARIRHFIIPYGHIMSDDVWLPEDNEKQFVYFIFF
jgi:hypothetical protein